MRREPVLDRLERGGPFDLAIVGGGATGLGIALDAAAQGHSVALVESHDFGGGTSSRATKLVHGGVRYLAQGRVGFVREALEERSHLLHNAPHLVRPLGFVMPSYRLWETPFHAAGLKVYDALAGALGLGATRVLGAGEVLRRLPTLRTSVPLSRAGQAERQAGIVELAVPVVEDMLAPAVPGCPGGRAPGARSGRDPGRGNRGRPPTGRLRATGRELSAARMPLNGRVASFCGGVHEVALKAGA